MNFKWFFCFASLYTLFHFTAGLDYFELCTGGNLTSVSKCLTIEGLEVDNCKGIIDLTDCLTAAAREYGFGPHLDKNATNFYFEPRNRVLIVQTEVKRGESMEYFRGFILEGRLGKGLDEYFFAFGCVFEEQIQSSQLPRYICSTNLNDEWTFPESADILEIYGNTIPPSRGRMIKFGDFRLYHLRKPPFVNIRERGDTSERKEYFPWPMLLMVALAVLILVAFLNYNYRCLNPVHIGARVRLGIRALPQQLRDFRERLELWWNPRMRQAEGKEEDGTRGNDDPVSVAVLAAEDNPELQQPLRSCNRNSQPQTDESRL